MLGTINYILFLERELSPFLGIFKIWGHKMKKKLLAILLSLLTLIFASNPTVVVLAESYSDSTVESVDTSLNYSISAPSDNQVVISDSTGETLLTQIDDNHFTMTRDDGSVSSVEVDNQGSVYM